MIELFPMRFYKVISSLFFIACINPLWVSCTDESGFSDTSSVPIVLDRVDNPSMELIYEGNKILEMHRSNTSAFESWQYEGSFLKKINFITSSYNELSLAMEYDINNRLSRYFHKYVNRSDSSITKVDLEYSDGYILKHLYVDQSTFAGPADGVFEFVGTIKLVYENDNIIEIDHTELPGSRGKEIYTYGSKNSPLINVDNFEVLQIIFSTGFIRNFALFGLPEFCLGKNNLTSIESQHINKLTNIHSEFNQQQLPKKISKVNSENYVFDAKTIIYR